MSRFYISAEAHLDLDAIWEFIGRSSVDAAERVETEFYETFAALARMPEQAYWRTDLTRRPVRFFPLYSYLIVYQPGNPSDSNYGSGPREQKFEAALNRAISVGITGCWFFDNRGLLC